MVTVGLIVRLEAKPGKEEESSLRTERRRHPSGLHFGLEEEALPFSMLSPMKRDGKHISTDLLPRRSWSELLIYLQSPQ